MIFNTTFTSLCALALAALTQAAPTNLTSNFPENIPETGRGSLLLERSMEGLSGGILKRNPPGWDAIHPADFATLQRFEQEGRAWFSPLTFLKISPPGAGGVGGANNPANTISFDQHVQARMGQDPERRGWQRSSRRSELVWREWTETEASRQRFPDITAIMPVLSNLRVGQDPKTTEWNQERIVDGEMVPAGNNVCIESEQDQPFLSEDMNPHWVTPTQAFYTNWYNVIDGVITMSEQDSKTQAIRNRLWNERPKFQSWSDLTWHTWTRLHVKPRRGVLRTGIPEGGWYTRANFATWENIGEMIPFLNWIVVDSIDDVPTRRIIKSCLVARRGNEDLPRISPQQPPIEFFAGHWCFNALLATQASSGIPIFLGMHKSPDALGHKLLASVSITSGKPIVVGGSPQASGPVLVWRVVDYHDGVVAKITRQQMHYLNSLNVRNHVQFDDVPPAT